MEANIGLQKSSVNPINEVAWPEMILLYIIMEYGIDYGSLPGVGGFLPVTNMTECKLLIIKGFNVIIFRGLSTCRYLL